MVREPVRHAPRPDPRRRLGPRARGDARLGPAPVHPRAGRPGRRLALHQEFRTAGRAPPHDTLAFQVAPEATLSRDLGERTFLHLSVTPATYLYATEEAREGTAEPATRCVPSFTVRVALGVGVRL